MPISISLPSPSIDFYSDIMYPYLALGNSVGSTAPLSNGSVRCRERAQQTFVAVAPISSSGGAGVSGPNISAKGGRTGALVTTTAATQSFSWRPDTWSPSFDDATFNLGALLEPSSVVAVWDFHAALTSSLFAAGSADRTGFGFQPLRVTPVSPDNGAPGGASPTGGFGVFANDDGGGNNVWEFVSYDGVPNILQRTQISPAVVPDVTDWTTFRFTIVGAGPGRPATLSLSVNSENVAAVQGLAFDDVTLFRPNTLFADAQGFVAAQMIGPALGGNGYHFAFFGRFGRFTASGEEIQGL